MIAHQPRLLPAILLGALLGCSEDAPTPLDLAQAPSVLVPDAGDGQVAISGATLAQPLRLRVTDDVGRPVPAIEVQWTTTSGTITPAVDSTDDDGVVTVEWTVGSTVGNATATAWVEEVGTTTFTATVQPMAGQIRFRYVEAGAYHACGITETEEMLCWGFNRDGQLGIGEPSEPAPPTLVAGEYRFRQISGGRYHSCAVTLSGIPYCWGLNPASQAGQNTPSEVEPTPLIVLREGDEYTPMLQQVSAGLHHTCGVSVAELLHCWGSNEAGQLGVPILPNVLVNVIAVLGGGYRAVAAGGLHTCAVTGTGEMQCFGFNNFGQLGNGNTTTRDTLTPIAGVTFRTDVDTIPRFPQGAFGPTIAAGFEHTCGIATSGATLCWGSNEQGQLGVGGGNRSTPTAVPAPTPLVTISAGYKHTCGLTAAGAAFCWGDNTYGQLGDGSRTTRFAPTAVAASADGALTFQSISAGDTFTCGVTTDGVAYCWGDNEYQQIGDLTTEGRVVPTRVAFQP